MISPEELKRLREEYPVWAKEPFEHTLENHERALGMATYVGVLLDELERLRAHIKEHQQLLRGFDCSGCYGHYGANGVVHEQGCVLARFTDVEP